jgi:hypothetical protein
MTSITKISRSVGQMLQQRGRLQVLAARMSTSDIDRAYKPDKFEKWLLKRYGNKKYATIADVPNIVQSPEMDLVKSKARVQLSVVKDSLIVSLLAMPN